ncbi:hypothetical protein Nepgr_000058 [Nepenthes gracilis]|uniref:Uncharacterized protein n=1 Tax=Nepenthes gracilis TaxID=150966 RepID=A0AAD3RVZ1_NEPGR|nr:hypothetical protein Nepgr_000058 [Nepenthes gracilis]
MFLRKLILSPQAAFAYSLPSTRSSVHLLNAGLCPFAESGFPVSMRRRIDVPTEIDSVTAGGVCLLSSFYSEFRSPIKCRTVPVRRIRSREREERKMVWGDSHPGTPSDENALIPDETE